MSSILIKNALVLPMDRVPGEQLYFRASVGVLDDRIEFICEADSDRARAFELTADTLIDGTDRVVMPGLINAHTHVPMVLLRGYADDMPLMSWLQDEVWPFEATLTPDDIALGTRMGVFEMLLGGTTCFADMYLSEYAIYDAVEKTGIRAALSQSVTDFNMNTYPGDLEALMNRDKEVACPRISVFLAPHAPYTLSEDNLSLLTKQMKEFDMAVHTHLSETEVEVGIIRDKYNMTPTEFMDKMGLLTPRTLAAHCVCLTDNDIDILRDRGVSVVHNPQSNTKLASGIAPVAKLLERGVNVALGTDGACSNNDLDMWEEMRSASFLQKVNTLDPCALNAYQTLQMATVNGAKALGMDDLGVLKAGNKADMIILDIKKVHLMPMHDLVANLAYCAKSSDVDTVIVDGRILVSGSKLVGVDLDKEFEQWEDAIKEILKRQNNN